MQKERLYYIDWLRVLVILSLVPFHAALTYTGLGDTYIKTPIIGLNTVPLMLINISLGSFFMTLLFFISGMAAYYSLRRRGSQAFMSERIRKVLVPFLLGFILLCPLQAYFKGLYEGFLGSLIDFYAEFFSEKIVDYLGYSHLWYLLYLFVFTLLSLPLFKKWLIKEDELKKLSSFLCKGRNIYYPVGFIIVAEMILRPFFPGPQTLITDWANNVVYFAMMVFGFVYASDTRIQERVERLKTLSGLIFLALTILYSIVFYTWLTQGTDLTVIWVLTKGIYECSAIIYVLWLGKKYLNRQSKALDYLNKASFTYYIYHFLPVSFFTYCFVLSPMNLYVKFFLVVLLSYLCIFLFYELVIKRIHGLIRSRGQ
jgi:peptidoglycan/LPS O-acetylase OafA/YrhL